MSSGQFFIRAAIITICVMATLFLFMPRSIVFEYQYGGDNIREIKLETDSKKFR